MTKMGESRGMLLLRGNKCSCNIIDKLLFYNLRIAIFTIGMVVVGDMYNG